MSAWESSARCFGIGPDLFFGPERREGDRKRREREARAKAICMQCPVRIPCLVGALERDEQEGVWGGTTPEDRMTMLGKKSA